MANACTNGIDTGFVALGYAKVAVLGVVQGITELMPISSTAHMRIVPALFGWQDPGSAFSAAMQLAALAAVISYFWRDVHDLLFGSLSAIGRRDFSDRSLKLAFGIAIGTIPIGIAGLALAKLLNTQPIRLRFRTLRRLGGDGGCSARSAASAAGGFRSLLRLLGLRLPRFSGRFVSLQSTSWSWRPACRLRRLSVSGIPGPNATAPDYTNPRCS